MVDCNFQTRRLYANEVNGLGSKCNEVIFWLDFFLLNLPFSKCLTKSQIKPRVGFGGSFALD